MKTIKYRNYEIEVKLDENPESPRDWDNLGTMACWHRRYNLGDEQPKENFAEWLAEIVAPHIGADPDFIENDQLEPLFEKFYISLPLYLYDHSGITINTTGFNCPWDSGQVGVIYVSKEKVRDEYGWKRITKAREKKICEYLRGEVETYDRYLRGDIWYFTSYFPDGEFYDSCRGFYDQQDAIENAKRSIDLDIERCVAEHERKLKDWIINRMPLEDREPLIIGV